MALNNDNSKYDEANALFSAKRWDEALPILIDLLRTSNYYDTWYQTHYLVGQCYRFTEQIEEAIAALEKCLSLIRYGEDPKIYGSCYLALGIAYQLNGEYSKALDNFALGFQKDPDNYVIDNSVGLTYRLMGNYSMALQAYNHSYGILIDNAVQTLNLGPLSAEAEQLENQFVELLESGKLKSVLSSNLAFSIVCYNIGVIHAVSDNPGGALIAFRDSIDNIPEGVEYDLPIKALENLLKNNTDESGLFHF
tara:strand:- start:93 stop:845 length:753 start_codon:yes stop_codon:yes gene_type:complete